MSGNKTNNMHNNKTVKDHMYALGSEYVLLKSRYDVRIPQVFNLNSDDGPITLEFEVVADFNKIPEKYHEIFLNMLTSKYLDHVSFGDNPFSQCNPPKKRRWWQIFRRKNH